MATAPTLPTDHVHRILKAVVRNLQTIDPNNDARYDVRTLSAGIIDTDPPEDLSAFVSPTGVQGVLWVVTDRNDDYEYLLAARVRGRLQYDIECYLKRDVEGSTPEQLRTVTLAAVQALWTAHWKDLHLSAADALLNGGSPVRLVTNHRIKRVERQYAPPDAYFRATLECVYDFSADAAS